MISHSLQSPASPPPAQAAPGVRGRLLAGSWWRAPFTATALDHCELEMLPATAWHQVLQNHAELAAELAAEAARCVARWRRVVGCA